jgi:hypothetical protein
VLEKTRNRRGKRCTVVDFVCVKLPGQRREDFRKGESDDAAGTPPVRVYTTQELTANCEKSTGCNPLPGKLLISNSFSGWYLPPQFLNGKERGL